MKAVVLRDYYKLAIEEVPEPEPEPNEVKIRVVATGICGSEIHAYKGTHPFRCPPAILGHEMTGEVVLIGAEVKRFAIGDRVTIDPQKVCGVCDDCRSGYPNCCSRKIMLGMQEWIGSFGEYIVCPESQVYRLPDHVSYYDGSMSEPLAVGVHAVRQAGIGPNSSVLVLGAGTIGLSSLAAAIEAGATTTIVTDVRDFNLEVARKLGATVTVSVGRQDINQVVAEVTGGKGVDAALVTTGLSVVVNQAVAAVRKRGKVVLIAIFEEPISITDSFAVISAERVLVGSQTYKPQDVRDALDLICSGQVNVGAMITHCLPIVQIQHAFEIVDKRLEGCIKVILKH
jgi:L-iditol 2-dehydrogenase